MLEETVVTSKGQVTIPKPVRERFGLVKGTRITFVQENNELVLIPQVHDPLQKMVEWRKKIRFTDKDLRQMIVESKRAWSKFN